MPIFNEAADKIKESYSENSSIVLGKFNCKNHREIEKIFKIFYYPNFILFRNGQKSKHKYKGDRTLESFLTFVDKEMEDPIIEFDSLEELDRMKRIIIGYFDEDDTVEYNTFRIWISLKL